MQSVADLIDALSSTNSLLTLELEKVQYSEDNGKQFYKNKNKKQIIDYYNKIWSLNKKRKQLIKEIDAQMQQYKYTGPNRFVRLILNIWTKIRHRNISRVREWY